ncbi:hemerythrin domain-containing protein, partial [Pectobacterium parmentieri]|nr:hemerythrin domain-containing protein [Pectobacterium parmentieri]
MTSNPSAQHTLLQIITSDHRDIEAFYNEYLKNAGNKDGQTRWANQLTWTIARHSISEELVVYPQFEKHLGDKGRAMAEQDRQDHQFVKDRLKLLEDMEVGSSQYDATLKEIMTELKKHMASEETEDLPLLEQKLGFENSISVAKSFERTKNFVP